MGNIKSRCYNKNNWCYYRYGQRGISMCDEWKNDFMSFYNFCIENGWHENLEIDRINNNGNYEPQNCRFLSHRDNSLNRQLNLNNKTGYRGVHFDKNKKKYVVQVGVNGKQIYLGSFTLLKDAVESRNCFLNKNGLSNNYYMQVYDEKES